MNSILKSSGDKILYGEGLLNILSTLGEVKIVGSYDLDLLVNPDIDITIKVEEYDIEKYFQVCTKIAQSIKPKRIKYVDQSIAKFKAFPFESGLFLGLTIPREDFEWGVDIWLFTPEIFEERIKFHNMIKEKLNTTNKETLLRIKKDIYKESNYKSIDLYNAVLDDNINSIDEFYSWYFDKYSKEFRD